MFFPQKEVLPEKTVASKRSNSPIEAQPNDEDVVIFIRDHSSLKLDPRHKRRVTWMERTLACLISQGYLKSAMVEVQRCIPRQAANGNC